MTVKFVPSYFVRYPPIVKLCMCVTSAIKGIPYLRKDCYNTSASIIKKHHQTPSTLCTVVVNVIRTSKLMTFLCTITKNMHVSFAILFCKIEGTIIKVNVSVLQILSFIMLSILWLVYTI